MDEGANIRVNQRAIPKENRIPTQIKSVRVYRDGQKLYKLEAAAVEEFIALNRNTAKIHYGCGQVTRIDLDGSALRKSSQSTVVAVGFKNYWHRASLHLLKR